MLYIKSKILYNSIKLRLNQSENYGERKLFYFYDVNLAKKNFAGYNKGIAVFYGILCLILVLGVAAVAVFALGDLNFLITAAIFLVLCGVVIVLCTSRIEYLRKSALTAFYKTKQGTLKVITYTKNDFVEANSSMFFYGVFTGLFNSSYFKKEAETLKNLKDETYVKNYVFGSQPNNKTETIISVDVFKENKRGVTIKGAVTNKNGVTKFASRRIPKAYTNYADLVKTLKALRTDN